MKRSKAVADGNRERVVRVRRARGRPSRFKANRARILEAAVETINLDGLSNASLEAVATKLSLDKTSLYYYFENKEELVYQCYVDAGEIGRGNAETAFRTKGSGRERFERYIRLQTDDAGPLVAFVSDTTVLTATHRRKVVRLAREHDTFLRAILEAGSRDGSLQMLDAHLTSLAIIGALNWTLTWWRPGRDPLKASEIGEAFLDIFLHGLSRPGKTVLEWPRPVTVRSAATRAANVFSREFQINMKREAVLRAASMFFNRNGYDNANLDQIVKHLGVSKGALYHYVSSKEELLYACYFRSLDLMKNMLDSIDERTDDGLIQLLRYVGSIIDLHAGPQGPLVNFSRVPSLVVGHQSEVRRRDDALQRITARMFERGMVDRSMRPQDARLARLAIAGATNWIPRWYKATGRNSVPEIIAAFSSFFANGLIPRP